MVTFSNGGAYRFAELLSHEQNRIGLRSRILTLGDFNLRKNYLKFIAQTFFAIVDNYIIKKNSFRGLFSVYRFRMKSRFEKFSFDSQVVYHLHWIPGLINYNSLEDILHRSKVVLTLHDTWFFTGGCHFNNGCKQFETGCSACPYVNSFSQRIVGQEFLTKRNLFKDKAIDVTSPSNFILNMAKNSPMFKNANFHLIRNPINLDIFYANKSKIVSNSLRLIFVSNNLIDPIKKLDQLLEILEEIYINFAKNFSLTLIGYGSSRFNLSFPWRAKGTVSAPIDLAKEYRNSDLLISNSTFENLPNTFIEAMASSTPVLAPNVGGIPELIKHKENGFLFDSKKQLKHILIDILNGSHDLDKIGLAASEFVHREFSIYKTVHPYNKIYFSD
jgi:glycosyltransferase involved in cell wall biosynthesis